MMMQQPEKTKYTYADYLTWNDGKRYELIDGEVYMMSPAPSSVHQEISGRLFARLFNYLEGKTCKVFAAPFDVRLNADTVVQPDISVICDLNKIDERGCKGAPDMVVEILSPSSTRHDQFTKFKKYLAAGVQEFWIVNPETRTLQVHILKDEEYVSRAYGDTDSVPVSVLEDCHINMAEVFPPAPPEEEIKSPKIASE
jgi:Uma2 family endonuclease